MESSPFEGLELQIFRSRKQGSLKEGRTRRTREEITIR